MIRNLLASRPVTARDIDEAHRAATPLELLFDLVSVIAIASATAGLHHAIAELHVLDGLIKFVVAFFMIWWAWMNYTWYASAYDNDDAIFRILTMVLMGGSLTIAAGVGAFFESSQMGLILGGFVVMRVGMVALWLRAASHDITRRSTALWYAVGLSMVQVYWVVAVLYLATPSNFLILVGLGFLLELAVPFFAEKQGVTPWHRHHMIERYGLLNIIVLGETLLAGSMALEQAVGDHFNFALVSVAISSLIILFALWWLYFCKEDHLHSRSRGSAFVWGYGHWFIYVSGAAMGAGFAVMVDVISHHAHASILVALYSVAIPVALYMVGLWFVRDRFVLTGGRHYVLLIFASLILLTPLIAGLEVMALLTVLAVATRSKLTQELG